MNRYEWRDKVPGQAASLGEVLLQYVDSDAIAAITADEEISYSEMIRNALVLAAGIRKRGIGPGSPIAVLMDPGIEYVTSAAATMLGNYIYVPMTRLWPENRVKHIAEECGAALIITEDVFAELMQSGAESDTDACLSAAADVLKDIDPRSACTYLYTSGSTGEPKGSVLSHRMVLSMIFVHENVEVLQTDDRYQTYMMLYNMSFAATTGMLYSNLICGRTTSILSDMELKNVDAIAQRIRRDRVDWLAFTISGLLRYIENPAFEDACRGITGICLNGEAVTEQMVAGLRERLPGLRVFDTYAATEMFSMLQRRFDGTGEPDWDIWPSIDIHIMDEDLNELEAGAVGELLLGGISPEDAYYIADPELTARKYVMHESLGRLFRSGDAAVRNGDGTIRLAGRVDDMIKIHGLRIEPGEIERAMSSMPGMGRAAVIAAAAGKEKLLCAFYTSDGDIDEKSVREHIAGSLPYYMIPAFFVRTEEIPVNVNGKLDRRALEMAAEQILSERKSGSTAAAEAETGDQNERSAAPRTENEKLLCGILEAVLRPDRTVGINDNFFALGGDSISAMKLISELRRAGKELSIGSVFTSPVTEQMAQLIADAAYPAGSSVTDGGSSGYTCDLTDREREIIEEKIGWDRIEDVYPVTIENRAFCKRYGGRMNVLPVMLRFRGRLDHEKLRARYDELAAARQMLRAEAVYNDDGDAFLAVLKEPQGRMFYADIRSLKENGGGIDIVSGMPGSQTVYMKNLLQMYVSKGFTEGEPLVDIGLIRTGDEDYTLFMAFCHAVLDGIAATRLSRDLMSDDTPGSDTESVRSYFRNITERDASMQLDAWRAIMDRSGGLTELDPAAAPDQGVIMRNRWLGSKKGERLGRYCIDRGITLSSYIHNALGRAFSDVTGSEYICMLATGSGRNSSVTQDESLTGSFMSRFPFVYSRGDSLHESQRQIINGLEYDWALHFNGEELKRVNGRQIVAVIYPPADKDEKWGTDDRINLPYMLGDLYQQITKDQADSLLITLSLDNNFPVQYSYDSDLIDGRVVEQVFDRLVDIIAEDLKRDRQ